MPIIYPNSMLDTKYLPSFRGLDGTFVYRFENLETLLTSTVGPFGVGSFWEVPGFTFEEGGPLSEAADLTTSGGVRLHAVRPLNAVWPASAFGCTGDEQDVSDRLNRLLAIVPDYQTIDLEGRTHLCTDLMLSGRRGVRVMNGRLKKSQGDTNLLTLDGCQDILFDGVDFDGNDQIGTKENFATYRMARNLVVFDNATAASRHIIFRNLEMRDSQNRAVACEPLNATTPDALIDGLHFENVEFRNCYNMAVTATVARNVSFDKHCRYRSIKNSIGDFGGLTDNIRVEGHASGCIQSAFTFHGSGVYCDVTVDGTIDDPDYAYEFLIQLSNDAGNGRSAVIRGRYLGQPNTERSLGCIRVRGYEDVLIDSPVCREVSGLNTQGAAINIGVQAGDTDVASRNVTIRNAVIEEFHQQGIVINDCDGFSVLGGVIRDTNLESATWYGIDVVASSGTIGGGVQLDKSVSTGMLGIRWDVNSSVAVGEVNTKTLPALFSGKPPLSHNAYHVNTGRLRPCQTLGGHLTIPAGSTQASFTHNVGRYGTHIVVTPKSDIGDGNRMWSAYQDVNTLTVFLATPLAFPLDVYFTASFLNS